MRAEPRAHAASTQLCTKGVDPKILARRAADLVDSEHAASQGRAARRASTTAAQLLPPDRWADDGQARSTTQCGVHGTRKLHGAKPRHRRDGRAQSTHPAVAPARREHRGGGMCQGGRSIHRRLRSRGRDRRLDGRHVPPPPNARSPARADRCRLCPPPRWDC
jgi:hypothetical protein